MIDLHLHTTASDGTCGAEELVDRARSRGIRTLSVTDHDTMASVGDATRAAAAYGMDVVPGIEITAVHDGRDVHVLGYFLREDAPGLHAMLVKQRGNRVERAREIAARLQALGVPIDVAPLIEGATRSGGKALARPQIARALIAAGHVGSVEEAFDRYLSETAPAYVPHRGASPADVVGLVAAAGGLSSLAHPGQLKRDDLFPSLVDAGLAAIEAYHSSHDTDTQTHYVRLAKRYGLGVSGGSDYHGEGGRRAEFFGVTDLPVQYFEDLLARAARARAMVASSPTTGIKPN